MSSWERGLDPYVFSDDAETFHTDGGIAGMQTFGMGAIEVTLDNDHIRLRSPCFIGPDIVVSRAKVSVIYRGALTGIRIVPKSDGHDIATYRLRGIRGPAVRYVAKRLLARGWPIVRLSPAAELRVSCRAGVQWLLGPRSLRGKSPNYEKWTKKGLRKRGRALGIKGRSKMEKTELIKALREH